MRRAMDWVSRHRQDRGPVWAEVMFACILLAWGISFLRPSSAFTLSPNYSALAALGTENGWGIALALYGAIWLAVIGLNMRRPRYVLGIGGGALLSWVGVSIFLSNPESTWSAPTTVLGLFSVYSAVRQVTLWTRLRQ